jgi:hypothetical protein
VSQIYEEPEPREVDGFHGSDALLDTLEPLPEDEISKESYRENCRRLADFVKKVLMEFGRDKQIAKKSRFIALCRLCGVTGYCGQSLRSLAAQHGLTPAAISAEVIELSEKLGFPHWHLDDLNRKTDEAREKYRLVRLGQKRVVESAQATEHEPEPPLARCSWQ